MTTFKELVDRIDIPALMAEQKKRLDEKIASFTSEERERLEALVGKIVMAETLKERQEIIEREYAKLFEKGGSTKVFDCANDLAWRIKNVSSYPDHEGDKGQQQNTNFMAQGGFIPQRGLHTPTLNEIMAKANRPDPTQPLFDTNSDHMSQINPLEPHWQIRGEGYAMVNPLNPGPKIPTNG